MKKVNCLPTFALLIVAACNTNQKESPVNPSMQEVTGPYSVLDSSKSQLLENSIKAFAAGNIENFTQPLTDDVKFYYPAPGDSLIGRNAVSAYYTNRWKLIDSIKLINPLYMAVKVNRASTVPSGDWLLAWYSYQIHYKSGNAIYLPVHTAAHQNASGKVDMMIMYYDMQKPMMAQRK